MDEQLCIQCRELIGHRRSYSWVSREEHYSDITQFIIGDLINRQVSLHKYLLNMTLRTVNCMNSLLIVSYDNGTLYELPTLSIIRTYDDFILKSCAVNLYRIRFSLA